MSSHLLTAPKYLLTTVVVIVASWPAVCVVAMFTGHTDVLRAIGAVLVDLIEALVTRPMHDLLTNRPRWKETYDYSTESHETDRWEWGTMRSIATWAVPALLFLGVVGGWFPLWKSARLSPDSIQRRVYWTCSTLAALFCFLAELPDWRAGLFIGVGVALALVAVALNWTGHVKIGGRKYAASPNNRRPDRPPALSTED